MKAHRLASYFPIMEGEKFSKFVEDIKENGQLEPIITFDGEILDGLNRYKACQQLGIEPNFTEYKGKDPLHYVISVNVHRRHMSVSQLAMVATEMLPLFEEDARKRQGVKIDTLPEYVPESGIKRRENESSEKVASEFGITGRSLRQAKRIKNEAPERVSNIISGNESVAVVNQSLRLKAEKERKEKAIAEGRTEKPEIQLRIEEQEYIMILESMVSKLPKQPPSDWTEEFFNLAKGYVNIIINRLEAFNE